MRATLPSNLVLTSSTYQTKRLMRCLSLLGFEAEGGSSILLRAADAQQNKFVSARMAAPAARMASPTASIATAPAALVMLSLPEWQH